MVVPDLISAFVEPIERLGVPYMVTGGVASVIYGDPRFTRDIDIVLDLSRTDGQRFRNAFDEADFYVPPLEAIAREAARARHGHFNVIHRASGLRADIYSLSDHPLHVWGMTHSRRLEVGPVTLSLAPPEYVILRKLEYYRDSDSDRHLRDIAMILRLSAEQIQTAELERWVAQLSLQDQWRQAQEFDPDA